MRLIGLAGWSGAGKTTLIERVLPVLRARGLRVSTVKHAHHGFDLDTPGKDTWRHREAGAVEVMAVGGTRWALLHERGSEPEPSLAELVGRLSAVDLVLVEGFRHGRHPRLEVFRAANGKPALHPDDPGIVAVASDTPFPAAALPVVQLDDTAAVASLLLAHAGLVQEVNCSVTMRSDRLRSGS